MDDGDVHNISALPVCSGVKTTGSSWRSGGGGLQSANTGKVHDRSNGWTRTQKATWEKVQGVFNGPTVTLLREYDQSEARAQIEELFFFPRAFSSEVKSM